MKRKLMLVCLLVVLSLNTACTQQDMARKYGSTEKVTLPKGRKLMNITWKDGQIWYLTREMKPGETAEEYHFSESSRWGLVEGTVIIQEQK